MEDLKIRIVNSKDLRDIQQIVAQHKALICEMEANLSLLRCLCVTPTIEIETADDTAISTTVSISDC